MITTDLTVCHMDSGIRIEPSHRHAFFKLFLILAEGRPAVDASYRKNSVQVCLDRQEECPRRNVFSHQAVGVFIWSSSSPERTLSSLFSGNTVYKVNGGMQKALGNIYTTIWHIMTH